MHEYYSVAAEVLGSQSSCFGPCRPSGRRRAKRNAGPRLIARGRKGTRACHCRVPRMRALVRKRLCDKKAFSMLQGMRFIVRRFLAPGRKLVAS